MQLSRAPLSLAERLHLPPSWIILVAISAAIGVIAWRLVSSDARHSPAVLLQAMLWPGAAVFVAVYVCAWLGWALDIG